jgi:hypothetical protein
MSPYSLTLKINFMLIQYHSNAEIIGKFTRVALPSRSATHCILTVKTLTAPHLKSTQNDTIYTNIYVKVLIPSKYFKYLRRLDAEATIALYNCLPIQAERKASNGAIFYETRFTSANITIYIPNKIINYIKF